MTQSLARSIMRRAPGRLLLIAAALLSPGHQAAAQRTLPPAFIERHASLALDVDFDRQRIDGTNRLTLENWTDRPATSVSFLLNRLMTVRAAKVDGRPVRAVQRVVRFADDSMRQVTQAIVPLARAVPPHGRVTIALAFGGNLVGYTETGSLYIRDHVDTAFTILRTDAYAFPMVGEPNDAANRRRPATDFTFDLDIGVPYGLVVSAAGTLVSRDSSRGRTRWRYRNDQPSPFINVCIAPYRVLTDGGLRLAFFPADSLGAARVRASVTTALSTLATWFGPLAEHPPITISEIPGGWGSQASLAGGIIQEAGAFREPGQLRALYHELSHLWNAPDNDRPSPRWNEGLAMFLQIRLAERVDGDTTRAASLARMTQRVRAALTDDPKLRHVAPVLYGREQMTDYSYSVGQLMFATLFDFVGEHDFDRIIGGYYQAYRNSGGTTDEFVRFAKRTSIRSLDAFFQDWMYTPRWSDAVARGLGVREIAAQYR